VAAGSDVDGEVIADALSAVRDLRLELPPKDGDVPPRGLAPVDVRHPIFASFAQGGATLGLVRFQNIRAIRSPCPVLSRFTTGEPALVECSPGAGRVLIFASDMDNRWNDFPLHATFLPFVAEVLRYLSSGRTAASEYLIGETPQGVADRP